MCILQTSNYCYRNYCTYEKQRRLLTLLTYVVVEMNVMLSFTLLTTSKASSH
jgi:hypothetical protein